MDDVRYEFVSPVYVVNRQCPLYYLTEVSNEIAGILKENNIDFFIGGSSALGTSINVTSDYMRKRTSCDVDIFVDPDQMGDVEDVMERTHWLKYDVSETGLIRKHGTVDGEKGYDEFQNIHGLIVYSKYLEDYCIDFLLYISPSGPYQMYLVDDGEIVEYSGYNRSPEESFVHKIFRGMRRDKSDFLAVIETNGFKHLMEDDYASDTFKKYLEDDSSIETLESLLEKARRRMDYYTGYYGNGVQYLKGASGDFSIKLHQQDAELGTSTKEFKKIMYGLKNKSYWMGESIDIMEHMLYDI